MIYYYCDICMKPFTEGKALSSHKRKVHLKKKEFRCFHCSKAFLSKPILSKHVEIHLKKIKCIVCSVEVIGICYSDHLFDKHKLKLDSITESFPDFDSFETWKKKYETENNILYTKRSSAVSSKGGFKKHYYKCFRSGTYKPRGNKVRHIKSQGSNKIGFDCPSTIEAVEKADGAVDMKFQRAHYGHDFELGRLSLTKEEKEELAMKLLSDNPFDNILDDIRSSVTESTVSRKHLLTKQDLYNIEREFHIKLNDAVRHSNDLLSVDAWLNEISSDPDTNFIQFYKPLGEEMSDFPAFEKKDFILITMNNVQKEYLLKYGRECICVDETHGLKPYNIMLTTVLTLDELHQGIPCAFLFSTRSDTEVYKVFFSTIKKIIGEPLRPEIFMADMADLFYNVWISVMLPPNKKLLCTWHVDRAWRDNLNKIKGKENQMSAYRTVRTLMEETNVITLNTTLETACSKLVENQDTKCFGQYFIEHFKNTYRQWAFAYRLRAGINTTMHLERMHKTIKYYYLMGKKDRRFDKALHSLMRYTRDLLHEKLIEKNQGERNKKIPILRKRHKLSESSSMLVKSLAVNEWSVRSTVGKNIYTVKTCDTQCNCRVRCENCNVCIHFFQCSCLDSSIRYNMCKHIHTVAMKIKDCANKTATSSADMSQTPIKTAGHLQVAISEDISDNQRPSTSNCSYT